MLSSTSFGVLRINASAKSLAECLGLRSYLINVDSFLFNKIIQFLSVKDLRIYSNNYKKRPCITHTVPLDFTFKTST